MIIFSQGDNAVLTLTAKDGAGNPINLTGATFSTQILGQNNTGPVTFGNSQHAVTDAANGIFTLTLSPTDTQSCAIGSGKDIVTTVTQSGLPNIIHGTGILNVLAAVPTA